MFNIAPFLNIHVSLIIDHLPVHVAGWRFVDSPRTNTLPQIKSNRSNEIYCPEENTLISGKGTSLEFNYSLIF